MQGQYHYDSSKSTVLILFVWFTRCHKDFEHSYLLLVGVGGLHLRLCKRIRVRVRRRAASDTHDGNDDPYDDDEEQANGSGDGRGPNGEAGGGLWWVGG